MKHLTFGIVSVGLGLMLFGASGCTPTVKVEAPDKPIHLKIDINIKQEILLKVEEDVAGISSTPAIPMAKRAGWIGERLDGYLGLVDDKAPQDVHDIVLQANEDRRSKYEEIADKHKTKLEVIEAVAGRRFVEKSGPGEFVQNEQGVWVKK